MFEIILDLAWYLTQPTLDIWLSIVIFLMIFALAWHYVKKYW